MRDSLSQPGELERLVTAREFRELLGVSDRTFRRWVSAGLIPSPELCIGSAHRKRWRLGTVRAFVEGDRTRSLRVAACAG